MGRVGVRGNHFLHRAHHRGPQTHAGHGNCCLEDRSLDGLLHGLFVTRKTTGPGASEAAAYRTERPTERHSGSLPSPVGVDGSGGGGILADGNDVKVSLLSASFLVVG